MSCDIKLCLLSNNKCTVNTSVDSCPQSGYKFTPSGCKENEIANQTTGNCEFHEILACEKPPAWVHFFFIIDYHIIIFSPNFRGESNDTALSKSINVESRL